MNDDAVDAVLRRTGLAPSRAFEAELESFLADAYDGGPLRVAPGPVIEHRSRRRLIGAALAAAVVVGAVVTGAVLAGRTAPRPSLVEIPGTTDAPVTSEPVTSEPVTSSVTSVPSAPPPPTTIASTPPTSVSSTAPTTTVVVPAAMPVDIDLGLASPSLEPTVIASYPITPPGDLFPTAYATPAGDARVAVLDAVSGILRFVDAATGAELSSFPTDVPTIGSPSFIAGFAAIGPDDVLYVNVGGGDLPELAAFAEHDGSYVEVARVQHGVGDSTLVLGRSGISVIGSMDAPIMPYVDGAGHASGATLDLDDITIQSGTNGAATIGRSGRAWTVTYRQAEGVGPIEGCLGCQSALLGPAGTVVLVNITPKPDGDVQHKITVLADVVASYDTDWTYAGALGDQLLFTHLDQDSIDIGVVPI